MDEARDYVVPNVLSPRDLVFRSDNMDFNNRNTFLTAKLLKQGCRYHKLRKAFSKLYRRRFELIEKFHGSLKKLMQQGVCYQELLEILYINLRKSLEIETSLVFTNVL